MGSRGCGLEQRVVEAGADGAVDVAEEVLALEAVGGADEENALR